MILVGDCRESMAAMKPASIDAIVCDPPYGLSFMGKGWDHAVPGEDFWREALRVAKPGAFLLAFGGTRKFHRLACAIEDAGWQLRDTLMWMYGQGFPKGKGCLKPAWEPIVMASKKGRSALNIDACRLEIGDVIDPARKSYAQPGKGGKGLHVYQGGWGEGVGAAHPRPDSPRHDARGRWPANVILDEGAAALLDEQAGDRRSGSPVTGREPSAPCSRGIYAERGRIPGVASGDSGGPSRFFYCAKASRGEREAGLDGYEIVTVQYEAWEDEAPQVRLQVDTAQSAPRAIAASTTRPRAASAWSTFLFGRDTTARSLPASKCIIATASGSITESKTLNYLARSLTSAGIAVATGEPGSGGSPAGNAGRSIPSLTITSARAGSPLGAGPVPSATRLRIRGGGSPATHPTVKPLAVMRWLVRLVTPPGGLVLDPFSGSGSTGCAAALEGRRFVGCEIDPEYARIAEARIAHWGAQRPLPVAVEA